MVSKIIVSNWEILSLEDQESVKECIRLILSARKSSANLMKLIRPSKDNIEVITMVDKISKESDDFEIIADTSINLKSFKSSNDDVLDLCEVVCELISLGNGEYKKKCEKICHGDS